MQLTKWGIIASATLLSALSAQTPSSQLPVARVGGRPIYEEDLMPLIGGQLLQLKNQEYELKSKALDNVVNQRLLQQEARGSGVSVDALLEQAVDRSLPRPSANEIEAYYLARKDRLNQPFQEVKAQLEQSLLEARRQQARQSYIDGLRQKADITILLNPPKVEVQPDPARLLGTVDAPVTIVEFADFECPYCQEVEQSLQKVMEKYKGKVRLGFRDFPLRQIHPGAQLAAEAARCAGEQGRYWEYHDVLYTNQAKLDQGSLREYARTVNLDLARFEACLTSGKFLGPVEGDLQAGAKLGVSATPTFYINGSILVGVQPLSAFGKIIEAEIAGASPRKPAP